MYYILHFPCFIFVICFHSFDDSLEFCELCEQRLPFLAASFTIALNIGVGDCFINTLWFKTISNCFCKSIYIFIYIVHCDSANPQLVSSCSFLFVPAMSSHSLSMYCKDSFVQLIASPLSCVALFFELQLLCSSVHSWSGLSCLHHFLLFLCTACSHFFDDSSNMSFSQPCSIVLVLFFFFSSVLASAEALASSCSCSCSFSPCIKCSSSCQLRASSF